MWFFFWLGRVQDMVVTIWAIAAWMPRALAAALPSPSGGGRVLVLVPRSLACRREIAGSGARPPTNGRRAGWALIGAWVSSWPGPISRGSALLATLFLVIYGLFAIVLGRLIAESGSAMSMSPLGVHETAALLTNLGTQTQQSLVAFGWWHHLGERLSDNLLPHQVSGMRVAEDVNAGRRVHLFLAVGAVVGADRDLGVLHFRKGSASAVGGGWLGAVGAPICLRPDPNCSAARRIPARS